MNRDWAHRHPRFGAGPFALTVLLSTIYFIASRPAVDSDYGWHIANGRLVRDGILFAGRDVYSWTATGSRWIAHEWLTDAAMNAAHNLSGPTFNSILAALIVTLAFALVAARLRKRGFTWTATNATVSIAFLSSVMSLGVRPQVLELVYLAGTLLFVDSWLRGSISNRGLYIASGAGSLLWANTHGSFPLLAASLAAVSAAILVARDDRWLRAAVAMVIAIVAALANPWGWELYTFATQSMKSQTTLEGIQEWQRPDLLSGSLIPFDAVLILIICAIPATIRRLLPARAADAGQSLRSQKTPSVPMIHDLFVAIPIVILGLQSGRHVMLAGICAAPFVAWSIDRALRFIRSRVRSDIRPPPKENSDVMGRYYINAAAAAVVAVAIAFQACRMISPDAQRVALARRYPVGTVASLENLSPPAVRLFNQYDWGGYLIERGRTKVFIDGRSEVYGDKQLDRYGSIIHLKPRWHESLDSLNIDYLLMSRNAPLVTALRQKGWTEIARDSVGSLLKSPGRATFFRSQPTPKL